MTQVNRETLKGYFGRGKMPTDEHFGDLVDSMLNIMDDGFDRTEKNGLRLVPLEERGAVIELLRDIQDAEPLWRFEVDKKEGSLAIVPGNEETPLLTFFQNGKMQWRGDLEVSGDLAARRIRGNYQEGQTIADGKWHDIVKQSGLKAGCRAYRVMAGCGWPGRGKYALLEATAMHCFGKRRRISAHRTWFGIHFNKLQLRWHKVKESWNLQIRTRCNYGGDIPIRYWVTELWDDPYFEQ